MSSSNLGNEVLFVHNLRYYVIFRISRILWSVPQVGFWALRLSRGRLIVVNDGLLHCYITSTKKKKRRKKKKKKTPNAPFSIFAQGMLYISLRTLFYILNFIADE